MGAWTHLHTAPGEIVGRWALVEAIKESRRCDVGFGFFFCDTDKKRNTQKAKVIIGFPISIPSALLKRGGPEPPPKPLSN